MSSFGNTPFATKNGVRVSPELGRILNLPQRDPEELGRKVEPYITRKFRVPGGTQRLKPLQALALAEASHYRGGLGPLAVGFGKSTLSQLLFLALDAKRPMLLLPAKHIRSGKYADDVRRHAEHWKMHPTVEVTSYEVLQRRKYAYLKDLRPDVIVADEASNLGNLNSQRCKAIRQYGRQNPNVVFIPLSGTMTSRTFRVMWHLQRWGLPEELHVLPKEYEDLVEWCEAIDSKVSGTRRPLGGLHVWGDSVEKVQDSYGNLLKRTPAVWKFTNSGCDASIDCHEVHWDHDELRAMSAEVRKTRELPTGELLTSAAAMWSFHSRLGNGCYYSYADRPPEEWLHAKRAWQGRVNAELAANPALTSEFDVARAFPDAEELLVWRDIADTHEPTREVSWVNKDVVQTAAAWACRTGGLIWVQHREVGLALEREHGIPFYAAQGRDARRRSIVDHPHGTPAVASVHAIREGFNLQDHWSAMLVLSAWPKGDVLQQMIGRLHRPGQSEDTITVIFLLVTDEQRVGFQQTMADARRDHRVESPQKLVLADHYRHRVTGVGMKEIGGKHGLF